MSVDPAELRLRLAELMRGDPALRDAAARMAAPKPPAVFEVAVVGMACRFPGSASPEAYHRSLLEGGELFSPPPRERWPWCADDGVEVPRMGVLDDVLGFDHARFSLSAREAEAMDPHHRLLLESVWLAMEDAGCTPEAFARRPTGVFVSMYNQDFTHYSRSGEWDELSRVYLATGTAHSTLPNRISFLFDLKGPSEIVDTACSSALVALHRAVEAIRRGECDQAVVGGVSVLLEPSRLVMLQRLGLLSPSGACAPFDAASDGQVMGEGVAAVLLRRADDAARDGDNVQALITASGVSHGGRCATGLTTPDGPSQARFIQEVYRRSGTDAARVSYVEAHGNGGQGDRAELLAFQSEFGPGIHVGSVKGNIGFLEAAGGLSQLIKVAMAMKHGVMPATRHHRALPDEPGLAPDGCHVLTRNTPLEELSRTPGEPFTAALHAYGLGGVNAHVVLRQAAGELLEWLRAHPALEPADVAFTLAVGRRPQGMRAGFLASSHRELLDGLAAVAAGEAPAAPAAADDGAAAVLARWLAGGAGEWPPGPVGRRVSLPPSPMQRRCFPLPPMAGPASAAAEAVPRAAGTERPESIEAFVLGWIAEQSGVPPGSTRLDVPVADFGIDSVATVALAGLLRRRLGVSLAPAALGGETAAYIAAQIRKAYRAEHGGGAADAEVLAKLHPAAVAPDVSRIVSLEQRAALFSMQREQLGRDLERIDDAEFAAVAERHARLFDAYGDRAGGVWLFLRMNEGNTFDVPALAALAEVVRAVAGLAGRRDVSALYVSHEGPHFSLGGHREAFLEAARARDHAQIAAVGELYRDVLRAVQALPCLTVAVAYGSAQGGGFELMLAMDLQVMWPGVKVGLPEIHSGLIAGMGGMSYVGAVAGFARAMRLNLTGGLIASDEAVAWGLVSHVGSQPFADAQALVAGVADRAAAVWIRETLNAARFELLHRDVGRWVEFVDAGAFQSHADKIRHDFQLIRQTAGGGPRTRVAPA